MYLFWILGFETFLYLSDSLASGQLLLSVLNALVSGAVHFLTPNPHGTFFFLFSFFFWKCSSWETETLIWSTLLYQVTDRSSREAKFMTVVADFCIVFLKNKKKRKKWTFFRLILSTPPTPQMVNTWTIQIETLSSNWPSLSPWLRKGPSGNQTSCTCESPAIKLSYLTEGFTSKHK